MKFIKRSLSLLLCLGMLLACLAIGAQAKTCNCGMIPRIGIPGIGDSFYLNYGTPEQESVDVADTEALKAKIWPILKDVTSAIFLRSWDKAADAFVTMAWAMLGHLQVDLEGKSVLPLTVRPNDDPTQAKDHEYFSFRYDWRLDPWDTAANLNAYIQEVKQVTGHSQVVLTPHSEGGMICMAYFARYGYGDVHTFIPSMSAHNGLTMVGELANRHVQLGWAEGVEYLRSIGAASDGMGSNGLMVPAANLLQTSGIAEWLIGLLSILLEHVQDRVYEEALIPLVMQWPAIWGFVPHEYYESARNDLLADAKYATLRKRADNLHYKAGAGYKADTLIKNAVKAGVRVYVIASYGYPTQPFAPNADIDADGLIDTGRESSGGTTAGLFNRTLPAGYKQKIDDGHDHLSPDGKIDASTCLLPEHTWFIRGQLHFSGNTNQLRKALMASPTYADVHSLKDYPQFLTAVSDGVFVINEPVAAPPRPTLAGSVLDLNIAAGRWIWQEITAK